MFGDLGKIMKMAGEMKRRMPEVQAQLANSTYTADAGGGVVTATVNGKFAIVNLKIDKALFADGQPDMEMFEDLVKAAISAAQQKAAIAAEAAMKELTGGMKLPGLDALL